MADYINPKIPSRVIVVTKDCDRTLTVRRRDKVTGEPVDWDAGAEVFIDVDVSRASKVRVNAGVDGSLATMRMESTLLNSVKNGATWRVILSQPGDPRYETPIMVGVFERNDGR